MDKGLLRCGGLQGLKFVRVFDLFGLLCSGFDSPGRMEPCSGCSVDIVEKLCENMWESQWEKLGKICGKINKGEKNWFCGGINEFFARVVEKFYWRVYTGFYLCKMKVLHSFHIAYYYNY